VKDRRIEEELRKNIDLRKELDKLKQERTQETWLLKNDIRNLEKSDSELQEQLKEQKKHIKASPILARVLSLAVGLVF
jgi:predicted phage-related endonuclease